MSNLVIERAVARLDVDDPRAAAFVREWPMTIFLEKGECARGLCALASTRWRRFLGKGQLLLCRVSRKPLGLEDHVVLSVDGVAWDWTARQFWPDAPWPMVMDEKKLRLYWEVITQIGEDEL